MKDWWKGEVVETEFTISKLGIVYHKSHLFTSSGSMLAGNKAVRESAWTFMPSGMQNR